MGNRSPRHGLDRPCDECGELMIGILLHSDDDEYEAPRKKCVGCDPDFKCQGLELEDET